MRVWCVSILGTSPPRGLAAQVRATLAIVLLVTLKEQARRNPSEGLLLQELFLSGGCSLCSQQEHQNKEHCLALLLWSLVGDAFDLSPHPMGLCGPFLVASHPTSTNLQGCSLSLERHLTGIHPKGLKLGEKSWLPYPPYNPIFTDFFINTSSVM